MADRNEVVISFNNSIGVVELVFNGDEGDAVEFGADTRIDSHPEIELLHNEHRKRPRGKNMRALLKCGGGRLVYESESFNIRVSRPPEIQANVVTAAQQAALNADLQNRVLALETQESRAVSFADYYAEKAAQNRINVWTAFPQLPAGTTLPRPFRGVNPPRGKELDVVKPYWKEFLRRNSLVAGLANSYEVAKLGVKTPDISFFQGHIEKPAAAEFVGVGDCKGAKWSGSSTAELGQVMYYTHRILDANPLRVHVYGFITNNERVVLIKGSRQQQRPFAVFWDISSVLTFEYGLTMFLYLLRNDSGYVLPPSVQGVIVTMKYPLRPGGSCRAFVAEYNAVQVVAKLYTDALLASGDVAKVQRAGEKLQESVSDIPSALIPNVVAAQGPWVLITPVGFAFTASTLRLQHLEKILQTLKIIHAANIVHRDVRFSNIFQLSNGNVLLNDWGSSTEGGVLQSVQGCPQPWCHPDLYGATMCVPAAKHDLYSLVSTTAHLLAPGLSLENHRLVFAEAFRAAEEADHDGVAMGFRASVISS